MTLKLITDPTTEPITTALAKQQCNVDSDDTSKDDLFAIFIPAARQECEHELGRVLITQTWERVLNSFPTDSPIVAGAIKLGHPPVKTIVSVKYLDTDNVEQTVSSANYTLDADRLPGWVVPINDYTWPATLDYVSTVRARFTAGEASAVPATVKAWMLLRIATMYEFRAEFMASGSLAPLPNRFHSGLIDRYRVYGG